MKFLPLTSVTFSTLHLKAEIVRFINMFENAHYTKPIIQELISRVLFEIETRRLVFCIALGPVTMCIAISTIGLLYFIIQGDILNA